MTNTNDEIDRFKRDISLSEYTAHLGYWLDTKKSSRSAAVMRHDNGDKIIIARNAQSGHWVYFSAHDEADNGTIIDFIQKRGSASLGEVRKELRPWIGAEPPQPRQGMSYARDLVPVTRDITAVQVQLASFEAGASAYLAGRGIGADVQDSPRFAGTIYRDPRGNTIFPHQNENGLCGYEVKNDGFTGFAKGGAKGLWCSRLKTVDHIAIFAETAIDALSYFALWKPVGARLFSLGGTMNPEQPDLIRQAVAKMPDHSTIILAMDNDEAGDKLAEDVTRAIGKEKGRKTINIDQPRERGQDWNDVLRAKRPSRSPEPS